MFQKIYIKTFLILFLLYQTPLHSKSVSFDNFNSKDLSKYFSGLVASVNKKNSEALSFFNSSKILIDSHDPFIQKYVNSLVLEDKVVQAINVIKQNKNNDNINFFDAHLLLIIDNLKKNDLDKAYYNLVNVIENTTTSKFNLAILESLRQYIFVFKEGRISDDNKTLGKLSIISETFQRCYLNDSRTDSYFRNLINDNESDFTRYIFFYLNYLVETGKNEDAKKITNDIEFINSTLLLSQGKSWIENNQYYRFKEVFSCKNYNDVIAEFLFLISNLYSSDDNFEKSNFYLNLSSFLNPKFKFNLSLIIENHYFNKDYNKAKKILKNLKKEDKFYYWFRLKKEAQIISKERNDKESLNFIVSNFKRINQPNKKFLFDLANFYKKSKEYKNAIDYYTKIIDELDDESDVKSDILYRRGASYERIKDYEKADRDFLEALEINPGDAYTLNYLAYSWLERDYKIDKAMDMLKIAYEAESDDPYIIDSIGWAYFLTRDYLKAEKFLKQAVELMPEDPIVNDHYGDILWMLNRKIQARYFWNNVLQMKEAEKDLIEKINIKMIEGLKNS